MESPAIKQLKQVRVGFEIEQYKTEPSENLIQSALENNFKASKCGIALGLKTSKGQDSVFTAHTTLVVNLLKNDKESDLLRNLATQQVQNIWFHTVQNKHAEPRPCQRDHPQHLSSAELAFDNNYWDTLKTHITELQPKRLPSASIEFDKPSTDTWQMTMRRCPKRPDQFQLLVNVGPIPGRESHTIAPHIYRALMISNYNRAGSGVSWALNPETSEVIMICEHSLWANKSKNQRLTANDLLDMIGEQISSIQSFWFDILGVFTNVGSQLIDSRFDSANPARQVYGRPNPREIH